MSDETTKPPTPEQLQFAAELDAETVKIGDLFESHGIIVAERQAQALILIALASLMATGQSFLQVMEFAASGWDVLQPQVAAAIAFAAMPVSSTVNG